MRSLLVVVVCLVAWPAAARADAPKPEDADKAQILALINAFTAALSAGDINKMDPLWLHESYVLAVNPRTHMASLGWTEVRKQWEHVFDGFWAHLDTRVTDTPNIVIVEPGRTKASATFHTHGKGTTRSGEARENDNIVTQVYEKVDKRWYLVATHAWHKDKDKR